MIDGSFIGKETDADRERDLIRAAVPDAKAWLRLAEHAPGSASPSPGSPSPGSPLSSRSGRGVAHTPPSIPDYEPIKFIAHGGFGQVWLARQTLTNVYYAVKVIGGAELAQIELEGIRAHKQRAANHPHLLQVEHVGEADGVVYYAMELADDARGPGTHEPGGYEPMTLAEWLGRHGAMPVEEAGELAVAMLEALSHLHQAGLLHRDVKPANVMRCRGVWKLGDVGLVTKRTSVDIKAGTKRYSPPEGVVDRSGDLYCLGLMLAETVTGRAPPSTRDAAEIIAGLSNNPDPRMPALADAIRSACRPNPSERFKSAAEFRAALPKGAAVAVSRRSGGMARTLIAAGLLVAAVVIGSWAGSRRSAPVSPVEPLLEMLVMPQGQTDGAFRRLEAATVPVATGDYFQAHVKLVEPGYPYLYFLSADGQVGRLYPPEDGAQTALTEFYSPPEAEDRRRQEWHTLTSPGGTEALLLLEAAAPVTDLPALEAQLARIRLPALSADCLLEGRADQPVLRWRLTRGMASDGATASKAPPQVLSEAWCKRFRYARVLAFPHISSRTENPGD